MQPSSLVDSCNGVHLSWRMCMACATGTPDHCIHQLLVSLNAVWESIRLLIEVRGRRGEAMEIMTQLFWLIMSVELVSWHWEVKAFREIWTIFGRASVQLHISTDIVTLGFPVFPQEGINSPYSPKRVPKIGVTLIGKSKSVFLCKVLGLFRIWC